MYRLRGLRYRPKMRSYRRFARRSLGRACRAVFRRRFIYEEEPDGKYVKRPAKGFLGVTAGKNPTRYFRQGNVAGIVRYAKKHHDEEILVMGVSEYRAAASAAIREARAAHAAAGGGQEVD